MALFFDLESGPRPIDELKALYHEPTYEEFAADCDQRWKEETKREKFEAAKVKGWESFVDKAALSAVTGRVVAIGLFDLDSKEPAPRILADDDESGTLAKWWQVYRRWREKGRPMVGCNIIDFDLPFLVRRSWMLGVAVPSTVIRERRWFDSIFLDIREVWLCGQRNGVSSSLDTMARALGVGQKTEGVSGKDFARLWEGTPEEREIARGYLENDLRMTAEVAERMGVL